MARRHWTLLVAAMIALGGCAGQGGGAEVGGSGGDADGAGLARMRQQAHDALDRYTAAVKAAGGTSFVPVGPRTGQIGDWEADQGDNKAALVAGQVVAATAWPTPSPTTGRVVWASGSAQEFPLLSPGQAIAAMVVEGQRSGCGGCAPLQVTDAKLTTGSIDTTRGAAVVPVWEFTLRGSAVRITRVAVDPAVTVTVAPPSWDPNHSPAGLRIESATTSAGSSELIAHFTGNGGPASQPCGADYTTEAIESETAVVVIVVTHLHSGDDMCNAMGYLRQAPVRLSRPLGERAVLEVVEGQPVPLTITP
ncbi:hypothetical protein Cs7R123_14940 [Catellatospora sp. TT07R-123]|uniref:hypothetical protein n=1 Tax=Catellatospora sp. TT07R-123 TaxID=2733863 RepID=UPI001B0BD9B0|nr:hypothetical protein [Catellatospora sp. TT07R-123]GHJ44152.1 hypothetical protein Cs7R123_14940 [Catellatospora sp. TT07R-123]